MNTSSDDDLPVIPFQEIAEVLREIVLHRDRHYLKPHQEGFLADAMVIIASPSRDFDTYFFQRKIMVAQIVLMILLQDMNQSCVEGGFNIIPDHSDLLELRGHWVFNKPGMIERIVGHAGTILQASYQDQFKFAQLVGMEAAQRIEWDGWALGDQNIPRAILADVELERRPCGRPVPVGISRPLC